MREFLPAPFLMYAWRHQRALKDNHLVKCIHYTGEKKETACLLVFWRCLVQTCYHSVLYHNNYSTVVQVSNLLSNLDYCSSHWHGEELYFNMLIYLSSSKPASSLPCLLLGFFSPPAMAASSEIGKSFLCCPALFSQQHSYSPHRQGGLSNHCQCCLHTAPGGYVFCK